jgi:hypothetical protein
MLQAIFSEGNSNTFCAALGSMFRLEIHILVLYISAVLDIIMVLQGDLFMVLGQWVKHLQSTEA